MDRSTGRRVLIVADELGAGGAERQLALLAISLPSRWEVRVWAMDGGAFADVLVDHGIRIQVSPRRFRIDPRPAVCLARTIASWRPDVVHSWGWMSTLSCIPACRLNHVPIVDSTIRTGALPPRRKWLSRLVTSRADRVVANSRAGLLAWGVASAKGSVIRNGFDTQRVVGLSCPRGSRSRFEVVMVGRIVREKDYRSFCEAARLLQAREPGDWRFTAIGDGALRKALIHEYRDVTASGALVIAEFMDEVLPTLALADVGVLMTDASVASEGCSNAIMEYMACGLPVVCSGGGGNSELVASGETGIVVPSGSVHALVKALVTLRDDRHLRMRLGEAGARRLAQNHCPTAMADAYARVYEELVGQAVSR